ncbi:hypothetical protein QF032_003786 [Streptomyces achromogenes]|uniref:hypothetical protein n=1 Tax=Streptomyces achromogenes TaxID=67255 RepID=UPI00278B09B7|nr:hypothetical protein [Streptomyces achromogenes]MDQ0831942.1 hypothetical protein [Streptomyces achromogenes]
MKTDPARAVQDEEILRLRCAGLSLRAIGARVGLSHQGVSDRITAALAELVTPVASEFRELEAARLNDLTFRAYEVLDGAEGDEVKLRAIDRLARLSESRRKLLGLDATEPIAVTLSRRADVEGEAVADAIAAALEVLGLDEGQRLLAVAAAVARLSGGEPPVPVSTIVDSEVLADPRVVMEERLRDLTADEGIDVEALLAEVDEEDGRDG